MRLLSTLTAAAFTIHVFCWALWCTLQLSMQVGPLTFARSCMHLSHSVFSFRRFREKHQLESQLVDADQFSSAAAAAASFPRPSAREHIRQPVARLSWSHSDCIVACWCVVPADACAQPFVSQKAHCDSSCRRHQEHRCERLRSERMVPSGSYPRSSSSS